MPVIVTGAACCGHLLALFSSIILHDFITKHCKLAVLHCTILATVALQR